MTCKDYRPDHNGECLTCDEPWDAHAPSEDEVCRVLDEIAAIVTRDVGWNDKAEQALIRMKQALLDR